VHSLFFILQAFPFISERQIKVNMKRKIDDSGEPAPATESGSKATSSEATFADLRLDPRLVQAIAKEKFEKPTLVQRTAIPLALDGQDVLAKAKTGSGKTLAYILPVLQSILKRKQVSLMPASRSKDLLLSAHRPTLPRSQLPLY
jgi:superfamily II DNA/RNA helicase